MSRANTEIKFIRSSTNYHPMHDGMHCGMPTVSIKLSSSDSNSMKVNSMKKLFDKYKWSQKINSGFARLRIYGNDPFSDEHLNSLDFAFDVLDPRFVDFHVKEKYLDKMPSRILQNKADTYTLEFNVDGPMDLHSDVIHSLSKQGKKQGNVQYFMNLSSDKYEQDIRNFQNDYRIYDSDIWLIPKGRKIDSVSESYDKIVQMAKRNSWNLSPRMDIIADYEYDA